MAEPNLNRTTPSRNESIRTEPKKNAFHLPDPVDKKAR